MFVLSLLDHGLGTIELECSRRDDTPDSPHCFIDEFSDNPAREPYKFVVDWVKPSAIENVDFLPPNEGYPPFEYVPSEIFTSFPNLKRIGMIRLELKQLRTYDFADAFELISLNLNSNRLKKISNSVFSMLTSADKAALRAGQEIKPDSNVKFPLRKLAVLWLNDNELIEIENYSFYGLMQLSALHLSGNNLTVIRERTFAGLPSLESLYLSANKIQSIEDGALKLPSLKSLMLRANKLKTLSDRLFQDSPALLSIHLEDNQIEYVGKSLEGAANVSKIALNGNPIRDLDLVALSKLPNLRELSLMNTSFTFTKIKLEDGQESNSELTILNLGRNGLSDPTELIKLKIFPRLRRLSLQENLYPHLIVGESVTLSDVLPSLEIVNIYGRTDIDCNSLRKWHPGQGNILNVGGFCALK